jgi:hypothetical protein
MIIFNRTEYRARLIAALAQYGWHRTDAEIDRIVEYAELTIDARGGTASPLDAAERVEIQRQTAIADRRNNV